MGRGHARRIEAITGIANELFPHLNSARCHKRERLVRRDRTQPIQPAPKRTDRLIVGDREFPLNEDRPGVEMIGETMDRDPGQGLAVGENPEIGIMTAISRKKRGMDVPAAPRQVAIEGRRETRLPAGDDDRIEGEGSNGGAVENGGSRQSRDRRRGEVLGVRHDDRLGRTPHPRGLLEKSVTWPRQGEEKIA